MPGCNIILGGIILETLLHVSVLSRSIQEIGDGKVETYGLTYLGNVDGKSYFYERYPLRTWFESKEACNNSNMHLATISSENQAKFRNEVANMSNYTGQEFWTAARDSQTISQLVWDENEETVSNPGLKLQIVTDFQTCLEFLPRLNYPAVIWLRQCSAPLGTLCETNNNE